MQVFRASLSCRLVVINALPHPRRGVRDSKMNGHTAEPRFGGPHGNLVIILTQLLLIWWKDCSRIRLLSRDHGTILQYDLAVRSL
jgi:hypothetical protein